MSLSCHDTVIYHLNRLHYVMEARGRRTAPNLIRVTGLNIEYYTQYTVIYGGRSLMYYGDSKELNNDVRLFQLYP